MSRKWLPFRGDDYSKENSKKYIPRSIVPLYGRLFVIFITIPAAVIVTVKSINRIFESQEVLPYFWLLIVIMVLLIVCFAARDAKKINSKPKDVSDN